MATTEYTEKFEIQSRKLDSRDEWRNDGIGDPNEFATEAEADEAIAQLVALGDEWADYEYRAREIA